MVPTCVIRITVSTAASAGKSPCPVACPASLSNQLTVQVTSGPGGHSPGSFHSTARVRRQHPASGYRWWRCSRDSDTPGDGNGFDRVTWHKYSQKAKVAP